MRLREMVLCGLFIALVAVGALIRIPVGSDVYTLQFMFTLLAGLLLGARLGALAVGTYVVMGLVGIPVFASGGGPSYVLQPTFGYLVGFTIQAWVCGKLARQGAAEVTLSRLLDQPGGDGHRLCAGDQLFLAVLQLSGPGPHRLLGGPVVLRGTPGGAGFPPVPGSGLCRAPVPESGNLGVRRGMEWVKRYSLRERVRMWGRPM